MGGPGTTPPTTPTKPKRHYAWRAVDVRTENYGLDDIKHGDILKKMAEEAQKWLDKVNPQAGKLAKNLPKVFSITRAVDVFITYVCVELETGAVVNVKVVKLDDSEALPWWAADEKAFAGKNSDRERAIQKNTPQGGCPP